MIRLEIVSVCAILAGAVGWGLIDSFPFLTMILGIVSVGAGAIGFIGGIKMDNGSGWPVCILGVVGMFLGLVAIVLTAVLGG